LASALVSACALIIIFTAVVVGVGRALIPHADQIRPWLEEELSERSGLPISIGRVEAYWPRLTPQITLYAIRVGEPDEPLATVDSARLEAHLPGLLQHERNLFNVAVLGLDVELAEDEDGHWGVRLEGGGQLGVGEGMPAERVLTGNLLLRDVSVRVVPRELPATEWRLPEAELERSLTSSALVGRVHPATDERSELELRMRADHPPGGLSAVQAWIGVPGLALDSALAQRFLPEELELEHRRLRASTWLEWTPEEGAWLDLEFDVEGGRRNRVTGHLVAHRQNGRTDAELLELSRAGEAVLGGLAVAHHDGYWALGLDWLDIEQLHALARPAAELLPWWPEELQGRLDGLHVMVDPGRTLHALDGRLSGLTLPPTGPVPGIEGLNLALALDGDRVALIPDGEVSVDWPRLLREEVRQARLDGRIVLAPGGIEFDDLGISHDIVDARANGWIYLGAERPFLDFGIEVERVEPGDPRPWLPHAIIPEVAMNWLDQALVHVDSAEGELLFHMRAGQGAANLEPGHFHADVAFAGARMDYWPEWPEADLGRGRVEFLGRGLYGQVPEARMAGLDLAVDQVVIADLTQPELAFLVIAESTEAGAVADAMQQLPVEGWQGLFEQTRWSGPLGLSVEVTLPFRRMAEWGLDGEAILEDVELVLPALGLALSDLRGTVFFDQEQVLPTALHAMAGERMLTLDAAADFRAPARLELGAELHPADLVADPGVSDMLAQRMTGSSYFRFQLETVEDGLELDLASDLEGMGLELPHPLTKLMPESWPLAATAIIADEQAHVALSLADRLELGVLYGDFGWRTAIGIQAEQPSFPESPGWHLRGRFEALDLEPWAGLADMLPGGPATWTTTTADVRVAADRLAWGDTYIEQVELVLERLPDAWELHLAGAGASGRATVPMPLDSGRVLAVDLEHLHLRDDSTEPDEADLALGEPPRQTSTASPVGYPPLHVLIEELSYRSLDLGRLRIESHATRRGVEVERIEVAGPALSLRGAGRWIDTAEGPLSEFEGRLITDSLTELMDTLGYQTGLEAARTQADLVGRWPGAPHDFSLQRIDGRLSIEVADGLIPEARPGAGRLLGLVSIGTIPRRLTLDFRDVFAQGLKFDRIDGDFELSDGVAVTENLVVDSPAARIRVSGITDMVERRYDQNLVVEPGVGGTLPILGVLAGGPMGAAAGLVLQTLLDRPLRGIAEARYSVTGSWESPTVDLVEARVTDEEGEEQIIVPDLPEQD
jgi:uncharacterized protein (TIGR02099 family)